MKKFQLMIIIIIMAVSAPAFASTGSLEAGIDADLGIEMGIPYGKKKKKKKKKKAKKQKAEKAEKKAKKQKAEKAEKAEKAGKEESDM